MSTIDYVVSVAAKPAIDVWRVTALKLLECVPAAEYEVIVPARDFSLFRKNTPSDSLVSDEADYVQTFVLPLEARLGPRHSRFGWYLQQFIKLEAAHRHTQLSQLLIWDADTVPLRPLTLFDSEGIPIFYRGDEHHKPYFDAIRGLVGLEKVVDFSFVAQCMPLTGQWASEFFGELEERHKAPWWQAIIENIDPEEQSGFSEYETIGTFVSHRFGPLQVHQGQWSRRGYHHFSAPERILKRGSVKKLPEPLDFLAFEDWKRPQRSKTELLSNALRGLTK